MTVVVSFDGDALTGSITEKSGVFTAELTGRRKTADDEGVEQGKRPRPTAAKLTLEGKKISVAFGNIKADSEDWKRLQEVKDGAIFTYTTARATKLYTDADLRFGEVLLKAENVAKDYPGVYSLWLKKSGGEWWLVFNEEPDIWGSQHRPEADVAEIPLTLSTADEEKPDLLIELVKEGDKGGVFRMVWGTQVWSAKFALAH